MPQPLSAQTIALVKATVPALEAHGLDIIREMYARMFQNPDIRDLFNQTHQGGSESQPRALTGAILAYANNIDNVTALVPAVERIAQKHVGLQILPEHYPHVAEALLGAIQAVLGDAATDEVLDAWGEAYWFLANILIARERRIYDEQLAVEGGWNGWRDFRIDEVIRESSTIASFILRPVDGGPVMAHKPGQYLTFWLEIPGHAPAKRNYSISAAANGQTYRISVKREPHGLVSGWLHQQRPGTVLKVAAPAGEFFLPDRPERPVVLLSGGVGLTPMVAMLEALGMKSLTVRYPEWPKGYTFEGPLLRDVLKAAGARGSTIRFLGLDGYEPEIPVTDAHNHDAVLAVKADGRYLGIGDRGPVWLVYPRDTDPKLKDMDDAKWLWAGFFMTVE